MAERPMMEFLEVPKGRRRSKRLTSTWQTIDRVADGFPFTFFEELSSRLHWTETQLASLLFIEPRTLTRRRRAGSFTRLESDRLARVARIWDATLEFFDDDAEAARTWLQRPRAALRGDPPIALAATDAGAREVERLLVQLDHGVVP